MKSTYGTNARNSCAFDDRRIAREKRIENAHCQSSKSRSGANAACSSRSFFCIDFVAAKHGEPLSASKSSSDHANVGEMSSTVGSTSRYVFQKDSSRAFFSCASSFATATYSLSVAAHSPRSSAFSFVKQSRVGMRINSVSCVIGLRASSPRPDASPSFSSNVSVASAKECGGMPHPLSSDTHTSSFCSHANKASFFSRAVASFGVIVESQALVSVSSNAPPACRSSALHESSAFTPRVSGGFVVVVFGDGKPPFEEEGRRLPKRLKRRERRRSRATRAARRRTRVARTALAEAERTRGSTHLAMA
mmetsp:Transcript_1506/g.4463  ORF Transcript_1506/g.4463 Transcript_1506/m.4463 type:complete len:306 (+) Transcript_1506:1217-2134(+)